MHGITFLQDLAVVMIVAGLVTVVFHRLKLPVVLGYIAAGFIIGPNTAPFPLIHDKESIDTLAELGIIFLLFSLGLEFNLRQLKKVGWAAFIAAIVEIPLMFWCGYEIGRWFGWETMDRIFLGAIISISSTTIIIKVLTEMGRTGEKFAQLVFGILIFEDILAIMMIALLSTIAMTGTLQFSAVALTAGRLSIFLVTAFVLGLLAVPRLLAFVARFKSNEMLLVMVLGLCFGFSLLAVKLGYSTALGAFIIGAIIAESRYLGKIILLTEPIRDMFSAVFFVAVGLLLDPRLMADNWLPILVISGAVVLGKVMACSFGTFVAGHDSQTALRVGMGLGQIGEFSFIIAALGVSLNVTSQFLFPIAVAVSGVTTLLTPFRLRTADRFVDWFHRRAPEAVIEATKTYTRWVGQLGERRQTNIAAPLVRKWILQMGLNVALMAGIFITAAFLGRRPPQWLPELPVRDTTLKPLLWLVAMILSLPLCIATFRKLQALGMLIAETRVNPEAVRGRAVVACAIPLAGLAILALWILALSSALLPPIEVVVLLLVAVALITWLLWRSFIKIYSKAQIALKETFDEPVEWLEVRPASPPSLLKEADLDRVVVAPGSAMAGRMIRELQIRTRTGASIVAIERAGASIVNPGPDEGLQADDHVLLLGNPEQIAAAREMFAETAED